jgi:hypothetical protein
MSPNSLLNQLLQLRLDEAAKEKLTDATDKKNW